MAAARGAVGDAKSGFVAQGHGVKCVVENAGQGRNLQWQPASERFDGRGRAFDLDDHALGRILNIPAKAELLGQTVDEGAESHALDLAGHDVATACTR